MMEGAHVFQQLSLAARHKTSQQMFHYQLCLDPLVTGESGGDVGVVACHGVSFKTARDFRESECATQDFEDPPPKTHDIHRLHNPLASSPKIAQHVHHKPKLLQLYSKHIRAKRHKHILEASATQ